MTPSQQPVRRPRAAGAPKQPDDPQRHESFLVLGRQVTATKEMGSVMVGDPGIVIERYKLEGRPGYTIIFKSGFMDGFSPDEVDMLVDVTDLVHEQLGSYQFRSNAKTLEDFHAGKFWPRK